MDNLQVSNESSRDTVAIPAPIQFSLSCPTLPPLSFWTDLTMFYQQ